MRLVYGVSVAACVANMAAGTSYAQQTSAASPVEAASAQSAAPKASGTPQQQSPIEDVVVTATRRPERLQRVPISITSIGQAELKQRGTDSLTDIAQIAPGLNLNNQGVAQENPTLRGVSTGAGTNQGAQQATVGLYLDDIPAQSAAVQGGAVDIPLFDIQRVEVLRGPQGTLFGSGSLSGGIRILTNKPNLDTYQAAFDVTGSGTEHGGANDALNLEANFPIVTDKLAVRVVGYDRFASGYVDNVVTGQKGVNDVRNYGGRVLVDAQPTEQLNVLFTLLDENAYGSSDGRSVYGSSNPNIDPPLEENTLSEARQDARYLAYNLDASYDFGSVRVTDSSTYAIRQSAGFLDFSGYQNLVLGLFSAPARDLNLPDPGHDFSRSDTFTEEVRLSSEGDGPFRYTLGAFYQHITGTAGQTIFSPLVESYLGSLLGGAKPAYADLGDLQATAQQSEEALFGEGTYTTGKFDFTLGLRASRTQVSFVTETAGLTFTNSLSPVPVVTPGSQKDYPITPRFAVDYRATDALTIYAQISRGFRTGGPNLTYGFSPGIPASYTSDTLWNYELGEKAMLLGGRVRVNTDVYFIDWSNIQIPTQSPAGNLFIQNAGNAHSYGLESEIAASPTRWLDVGASTSLNRAELATSDPTLVRASGAIGAFTGDRLPAAPQFTISAYTQLNFEALQHPAYFRIDENYVGEESTDFADEGAKFGNYNLVNLRAGIHLGAAEVVAFVDNAFDNQGINNALVATFADHVPTQLKAAFRNRPLTAGLTLRDSF